MHPHTPRRLLTSVLTATMLTTAAPALAQSPSPAATPQQTRQTSTPELPRTLFRDEALTQHVIDRFDPYVTYDPKRGYVLDLPRDVHLPRSQENLVRATIANTNADLTAGPALTTTTQGHPFRASTTSTGSHGGITNHWWGYTLWLDNWATNLLTKGLYAGSGVAWVAAELTSWTGVGGLTGGAIAALLALGAAAISLCNWNDRGVGFHFAKPYPYGPSWCWAR